MCVCQNIVVYEALKSADGHLDDKKPVDVYWLDIDPAYVAAARKKGNNSDRNEVQTHAGRDRGARGSEGAAGGSEAELASRPGPAAACQQRAPLTSPLAPSHAASSLSQLNMIEK